MLVECLSVVFQAKYGLIFIAAVKRVSVLRIWAFSVRSIIYCYKHSRVEVLQKSVLSPQLSLL